MDDRYPSTDDLDLATQTVPPWPHHSSAQLVQPDPRGLVAAQPEHALKPKGADTVLLAGHVPGSREPCGQWTPRLVEDRACGNRRLQAAARALPVTAGDPPRPSAPTPGADEALRPSEALQVEQARGDRNEDAPSGRSDLTSPPSDQMSAEGTPTLRLGTRTRAPGLIRATPRSSASRRLQRLGPVPGRRPGLQSGGGHRAQAVLGALPKRGGIALPRLES